MTDYISDSEPEELLANAEISGDKVADYLQRLPDGSKHQVITTIRRKYGLGPNDMHHPRSDNRQGDSEVINGENQDIETALSSLLPLAVNHQSRRGLRKRNFASTHPYLADQAHWLGLASTEYLNDIYEQHQDLETMLKLLNQQYLRNKKKYPKEDRYKSKSFYKFLGRTHPNSNRHNESKPIDSSQYSEDPPIANNEGDTSDDAYESDGSSIEFTRHKRGLIYDSDDKDDDNLRKSRSSSISLIDVNGFDDNVDIYNENNTNNNNHHHNNFNNNQDNNNKNKNNDNDIYDNDIYNNDIYNNDNDNDDDDDNDNEKSDNDNNDSSYVRVGGRIRKERSVLRGVLPESARRLEIYTGRKNVVSKSNKKEPQEIRKGLAIKKKSSHKSHFLSEGDLYNELFTNDSDSIEHYEPYNEIGVDESVDSAVAESAIFDSKYGDYLSDLSNSESECASTFPVLEQHSIDSYLSPEDDEINTNEVYGNKSHYDDFGVISSRSGNFFDQAEINADIIKSSARKMIGKHGGNKRSKAVRRPHLKRISKPRDRLKSKVLDKASIRKTKSKFISPSKSRSTIGLQSTSKSNGSNQSYLQNNSFSRNIDSLIPPTEIQHSRKLNHKQPKEQDFPGFHRSLSQFYFRRDPSLTTTVFEAESNNRFVNFNRFNNLSVRNHNLYQRKNPIVDIELSKLCTLNEGFSQFIVPTGLSTHFNGSKYSFDIVNKNESVMSSQSLLLKVAKFMNEEDIERIVLSDISQSLQVLIYWHLTVQELPNDIEWKYLRISLSTLVKRDSEKLGKLLPYLLCLFFVFWKLTERYKFGKLTANETEFIDYCGYYWKQLFKKLNNELDDVISVETNEDYDFISQLLNYNKTLTWRSLESSLTGISSSDLHIYLDGLFFIANKLETKFYDWKCFYDLYDSSKDLTASNFFNDFLDVCFLLNQRKSWPIEEKLILKLYSTVTRNKFFNFDDETSSAIPISKIYTFNDIPNTSFFERYMQFLYYYASSLEKVSSIKRLATKLLISSNYQFSNERKYQVAFINRFNFIILLSQISDLNQTSSINNLIKSILDCNNVKIYQMAIRQLKSYCEIIINKDQMKLPIECFGLLLTKMAQLTLSLAGSTHVLIDLTSSLKKAFSLEDPTNKPKLSIEFFKLIATLDFKDFYDTVTSKLIDLMVFATQKILYVPQEDLNEKLLREIIQKTTTFINYQMGRFPMQNRVQELRLTKVIEDGIWIWIQFSKLINSNWNKILLQDFPYIGNSYSRELFILFLFSKILEFDKLEHHKTAIIETLLKNLSKLNTSPYLVELINTLRKQNYFIIEFKNSSLNRSLSAIELSTNKFQIISNIVSNIMNTSIISEETKSNIIHNFVESLNEEYDKCYMSPRFVENCKKIIQFLQLQCPDLVSQLEMYQELASKLDITPVSINQLKWKNLPQIEQLSFLHKEFVSSVIYQKDIFKTLDQYTEHDSLLSIYHLLSIYLKGIIQNQPEFWMLFSILIDYLLNKLETFKIDISDRDFGRFILMMNDITSVYNSRSVGRFSNALRNFQLKTMVQACNLLKLCYTIYDGYKDQSIIIGIIQKQIMDYRFPSYQRVNELSRPFSHYIFYDISNNFKELSQLIDERLYLPELEKYDTEKKFNELNSIINEEETPPTSETLEFEF